MNKETKAFKIINSLPTIEMTLHTYNTLPSWSALQMLNSLAKERVLTIAKKKYSDVPDNIGIILEFDYENDEGEFWQQKRVIFL